MQSCKILMTSFITEGNRVGNWTKKKIGSLHAIHKGNKNVKKKKNAYNRDRQKNSLGSPFSDLPGKDPGKTSWQNKKPVRKLQHFIYCEPETHPFHISDGINCFMFLQ